MTDRKQGSRYIIKVGLPVVCFSNTRWQQNASVRNKFTLSWCILWQMVHFETIVWRTVHHFTYSVKQSIPYSYILILVFTL